MRKTRHLPSNRCASSVAPNTWRRSQLAWGGRVCSRFTASHSSPMRRNRCSSTCSCRQRPWLDLAVGTVEDGRRDVSCRRKAARSCGRSRGGAGRLHRHAAASMGQLSGRSFTSGGQGGHSVAPVAVGVSWRARLLGLPGRAIAGRAAAADQSAARSGSGESTPPQGVIFIQADTLRRDHLNLYGHSRETAPFLTRMAKEGVQFNNAISQGELDEGVHQLDDDGPLSDDAWRSISRPIACRRR